MAPGDQVQEPGADDPNSTQGIDDADTRQGIEDPNIRPGEASSSGPDIRPGGDVAIHEVNDQPAQSSAGPDIRPGDDVAIHEVNDQPAQSSAGPDIRPGDDVAIHEVNDQPAQSSAGPDIRPGDDVAIHEVNDGPSPVLDDVRTSGSVDDFNTLQGITDPSALQGATSGPPALPGGLSLGMPKLLAIGAVVVVVIVAAIVVLKPGGGGAGPAGPRTATLVVTGGIEGNWALELSGDVSPDASLIASTWGETFEGASSFADIIMLTVSGDVVGGSRPTSADGVILSFEISRIGADGFVFDHQFSSRAGECTVTMTTGATVSGSFDCASVTDSDGHTVKATGSFST